MSLAPAKYGDVCYFIKTKHQKTSKIEELKEETYKNVSAHLDGISLPARTPEVCLLPLKRLLRCGNCCSVWALVCSLLTPIGPIVVLKFAAKICNKIHNLI